MKKILIIENDLDTLDIVAYVFEDNGFQVLRSQHIVPIEEIVTLNPDLIVIDHWLDDGYGSELCMKIKNHPIANHLPVLLMSAANNIEKIADDSCADGVLVKPFDISDLEKIVKDLALLTNKALNNNF